MWVSVNPVRKTAPLWFVVNSGCLELREDDVVENSAGEDCREMVAEVVELYTL